MKTRDNVYEVLLNDFAHAFIQCTTYNAFLTFIASGTILFCLQTARRSGNLSFVFKAMEKLPGSSDFLVNIPQYVGEEVFGSAKR